jgi:hypothetical protein
MYAPICIFAYNRVDHLQRLTDSLQACPLFRESELLFFADGPRPGRAGDVEKTTAVREFIEAFPHPRKHVFRAESNQGLATSLRGGITRCLQEHDRVIVLEDDLIAKPALLEYMNAALQRYAGHPRVFQVSGHAYPTPARPPGNQCYFLPFITSWGWATWKPVWDTCRWSPEEALAMLGDNPSLQTRFDLDGSYPYFRMLQAQQRQQIDSWAILWYWNVFRCDGIALYPAQTLIENRGFDGTGTHGSRDLHDRMYRPETPVEGFSFPPEALVNLQKYGEVTAFLRQLRKLQPRDLVRYAGKLLTKMRG